MTYEDQLNAMQGYGDKPMPGEQQSIEWLQSRVGHCTASRFKDVLDFTKAGKEGAKRSAYRMELVVERITGKPAEHFVNDAMVWGTETEPLARMAYEAHTGAMVTQTGFLHHKTLKYVGGSPDGLIDDDGGIEIKCPSTSTHIKTLLSGECDHLPQIQGLMWITGRQWWDFVSFDPRLPEGLQLFIKRVQRDNAFIDEIAAAVINFVGEVNVTNDKLSAMIQISTNFSGKDGDIPPLEL
jgi:predicted phage-related endonuclease